MTEPQFGSTEGSMPPPDYPPQQETTTAVATGNESVSAAAGITGEQFWDSVAATPSLAARERPRRSGAFVVDGKEEISTVSPGEGRPGR